MKRIILGGIAAYLIVGAYLMRSLLLAVLESPEPGMPKRRVPVWPFAILGAAIGVPLYLYALLGERKEHITSDWRIR